MSIEIVEITDRSDQGMTRPFICRGEDSFVYFVKGRGAGRRSLICEWAAGQLALRLGLPIAPFELVHIPEELLSIAMRDDLDDLGAGLAFGSRRISVVELTVSHLEHVPDETQRDVLTFDWWVCMRSGRISAIPFRLSGGFLMLSKPCLRILILMLPNRC